MTKVKNGFWNFMFGVGAILGGGYLLNEWLKGKKYGVKYYACPKCGYDVLTYGETPCPNCGQKLKYDDVKQQ